jgi:hypothetical protein
MKILHLNLKTHWFNDIKNGTKKFEYRVYNKFWKKRILGKEFDRVCIHLGYPKRGTLGRTLTFRWRGFKILKIVSAEFGLTPVRCFAIDLNHRI